MKNKETRESRGVAFILFLKQEDALRSCETLDGTVLHDRTIKCSIGNAPKAFGRSIITPFITIAVDNGRTPEFIKKKVYADKSRCFECGDAGHLSYQCPKNIYGERQKPAKKKRKRNQERKAEEHDSEKRFQPGLDVPSSREGASLPASRIRRRTESTKPTIRLRGATHKDQAAPFVQTQSSGQILETHTTENYGRGNRKRKSGYFR